MQSPAYLQLSGDSTRLLLGIVARFNGHNNGEISMSVREAAKLLNCTPNTAGRRFKELQEKGFIALVIKGAFSMKAGQASIWRLTFHSHRDTPPTREYQAWRPQNENTVSTDADTCIS